LLLWAFLIYYIVVQAQYLASKPTSTSLTREPQSPYVFPAISMCLTTLNSTKAEQFLREASGIGPVLNGSTGMACSAGLGNPNDDIPEDGACGGREIQWIDFPFTVLPTICVTFNTPPLFSSTIAGASLTIAGRFPQMGTADLITYSLDAPNQPLTFPILNSAASKGVLTKVLFQEKQTKLIKDCDPNNQAACQISFQQKCVESLCNCQYPEPNNPITIPGSCELAFRSGECPIRQPIFPCQSAGGTCTLLDACNPEETCPNPSCEASTFTLTPSFREIASPDNADLFVMSFVLASNEIEIAQETLIYNTLQFLSSILGLLAGLLGFSVVTIFEFCDNGFSLGRKKRAAAHAGKMA
jgi:hypothetical protein